MKLKRTILPLLTSLIFVFLSIFFLLSKHPNLIHAQTNSFTFGVAGDYASTSNTDKVLTAVRDANVAFQLAVGDLSYDTQGSPAGWGSYVKNIIGDIPFLMVVGNHDESQIDQFIDALPNTMNNLQGEYGKQYYFDYPESSPLARFIMISPVDGTKDIAWFNSAVDSARSAGIKWIIAGMHEPCVTTGVKSCEIGQDMMNALTTKKVDVVLFGHEHNYQRSKQVTCAKINTYDTSCIAASGGSFTQGKGTVMVIVGTGGNSLYEVSSSDSEAGYFDAINGTSWGFAQFTISPTQLQENYVSAVNSFSDSFTINAESTITPSPLVTTTIVPTFQCLGGVPCTSPDPSTQPSISITTTPSTAPTSGNGNTTPSPSIDPCALSTNTSVASHHGKHHRKFRSHREANSGLFESLLKLFMELLKLLFGNEIIPDNPNIPNPSTTPIPTTNPCPSPA